MAMRHSLAQAHALSGPAPHTTGLWAHGSTHPHTRFLLLRFPCTPPRLHRAPSCSSFPSPHLPTSPSPHVPTSPSPHLPISPSPHLPTSPPPHLSISPPPHLPTSPQTEMFPSPPHSPSPYTAAGMGSPSLCPYFPLDASAAGQDGQSQPRAEPQPHLLVAPTPLPTPRL